jgi:hypothetical protein
MPLLFFFMSFPRFVICGANFAVRVESRNRARKIASKGPRNEQGPADIRVAQLKHPTLSAAGINPGFEVYRTVRKDLFDLFRRDPVPCDVGGVICVPVEFRASRHVFTPYLHWRYSNSRSGAARLRGKCKEATTAPTEGADVSTLLSK